MNSLTKLDFSINLSSKDPNKLMEIATDYRNFSDIFTGNMKCIVLEENNKETITEEIITTSKVNLKITQKSSHRIILPNKLETKIISGPLKNSTILITFQKIQDGTSVTINAELKLGLKYKILYFILIKKYKMLITKLFRRMGEFAILTEEILWKDALKEPWRSSINVDNRNIPIELYGWWTGDPKGIFIDEEYSFLPVKNRTVIDIGANIADSSIYFAALGAVKVIAIEPLPKNFQWAKKNIEINNLSEKIILLQAICSSKKGKMLIDPEIFGGDHILLQSKNGVEVPTMNLSRILEDFKIQSAVLKIDCEGCEYDAIMSTPNEILKKFSHIQIEYHSGYRTLKKKLTKCGFGIKIISKPMFGKNVGIIQAQQN